MDLLAINIPTFERLESFSEVMLELENDLNLLSNDHKNMVKVNVFDNNSTTSIQKQQLCNEVASRSKLNIQFSRNETNIGGDNNIKKCCESATESLFTWVLGDDDHIVEGGIPKIISLLLEHKDKLGLLIIMGEGYSCNPVLWDKLFNSYEEFARRAIKCHPDLLIAHALISSNIFRTRLFDSDETTYVIEKLTPREGLSANLAHMRGIIKGMFRNNDEYSVLMPSSVYLNVSERQPGEVNIHDEIPKIFYFYFLWLLIELGIRIEEVPHHNRLWWLYSPKEPKGLRRWFRSPLVPRLKVSC